MKVPLRGVMRSLLAKPWTIAGLVIAVFFLWWMLKGCSKGDGVVVYKIAQDVNRLSQRITGKERNLQAFAVDLLEDVAYENDFEVEFLNGGGTRIFEDLDYGTYDAAVTDLSPNVVNQEKYIFSEPFYLLGPVLVVPVSSKATSLQSMDGKVVGLRTGSSSIFKVERYPSILIVSYDNMNTALEDLQSNKIDGLILDAWSAYVYAKGFYAGKLKVATAPLTQEGIRLMGRKDARVAHLIDAFNEELKALKQKGEFSKLLSKWGLIDTENPNAPTS